MLHIDQVKDLDHIALVSQVLAHGLVELGFGICYDYAVSTAGCLEDQISGDTAGFACTRSTTHG